MGSATASPRSAPDDRARAGRRDPPRRRRRRRADGGRAWWDWSAQGGPGAPPWATGGPPWSRPGQDWGHGGPPWTQPGWAGPPRRWFVQRFAAVLIVLLIFVVILASVGGFVFASIFGLLGPDRPGQGGAVLTLRLGGVLLLVLGILFVGRPRPDDHAGRSTSSWRPPAGSPTATTRCGSRGRGDAPGSSSSSRQASTR